MPKNFRTTRVEEYKVLVDYVRYGYASDDVSGPEFGDIITFLYGCYVGKRKQ